MKTQHDVTSIHDSDSSEWSFGERILGFQTGGVAVGHVPTNFLELVTLSLESADCVTFSNEYFAGERANEIVGPTCQTWECCKE
jgi:hypothetical protein